jgi:hypothetical protein
MQTIYKFIMCEKSEKEICSPSSRNRCVFCRKGDEMAEMPKSLQGNANNKLLYPKSYICIPENQSVLNRLTIR